jgi:4-amino-4-deoxy-L-arabinose transferase-like glycosyltransferase
MVGWIFWLGTWLESFGNAARLPGVWLGFLTLLIWNKILEPFLTEKDRSLWLIFMLASPFFGLGSLIITPDVPLLFFWSLSLLLLLKALEKPSALKYAALGATLGLGFCSKYMIVVFVPTALSWLAFTQARKQIQWRFVPLTAVVGLLFCFPVIYWNSQHDWVSFRFQLNHGLDSEKWNPGWPLEYLGGQILILFPTVVWFAARRWKGQSGKPTEPLIGERALSTNFLHFFGWFPLAFFLYTSFKAHVEANWPIMAHPALLSLAFLNAPNSKALRATAALWLTVQILVLTDVAHHWVPVDVRRLKTFEFTHFDVFIPEIERHQPFYLGSYQSAAAVSYKMRQQTKTETYKLNGLNRRDFYDFVPASLPKSDSFWMGVEKDQPLPEWALQAGYREHQAYPLNDEFRVVEVKRVAQDPHH